MKERRKNKYKQHEYKEDLPDEHPGAVAQRKKRKKNIFGTILLIAGIAGVVYLAMQGG